MSANEAQSLRCCKCCQKPNSLVSIAFQTLGFEHARFLLVLMSRRVIVLGVYQFLPIREILVYQVVESSLASAERRNPSVLEMTREKGAKEFDLNVLNLRQEVILISNSYTTRPSIHQVQAHITTLPCPPPISLAPKYQPKRQKTYDHEGSHDSCEPLGENSSISGWFYYALDRPALCR